MLINIKRLTLEEYLDATELGGGYLFDYNQYRFIESTDYDDRPRYIVVNKKSSKSYEDIDPRYDEVEFVELRLIDFHNLCSLYILSLQEGCREAATESLKKDLDNLFSV